MNWVLVFTMLGLIVFGIFSIYGASWMREDANLANKWRDQIVWVLIGLSIFFVVSLIDYQWVKWAAVPFYIGALILLIIAEFRGVEVYGTQGWLRLPGGITFQPSQVAIAAGIVALSLVLSHLHKLHPIFRNHFLRVFVAGVVGGIPFLLVLKSGDLGSALVWAPVIGAMLLVGSIPFRYLIVIVLSGTLVLPFAYFFGLKDYQKKRITVQIDMLMGREVDIRNEAYSAHNNLMAIGSGGWGGKGFKNPDTLNYKGFISKDTAITDFIFPVLAEEHGFRGAFLMLSAFLLLLLQSLFVAFYAKDMTGRLLVVGVVALFFAHIFQNVGMNILLMPITGIPLPLISYGGTFMVMVLFLQGLVQSVWIHRRSDLQEPKEASGMQIDHLI
ncbi:MAG: FtsW/RodA/SpoVE family cell cycle protein [Verrucomicrobia bacterium]|nr:FtsW/RodA/SpoVE family cell cycle protein [Verrucomicrobiota bacterium]